VELPRNFSLASGSLYLGCVIHSALTGLMKSRSRHAVGIKTGDLTGARKIHKSARMRALVGERWRVDISRAGYASLTATGIKSRVQLTSPAVSEGFPIRAGDDRLTFTASDPSCSSWSFPLQLPAGALAPYVQTRSTPCSTPRACRRTTS